MNISNLKVHQIFLLLFLLLITLFTFFVSIDSDFADVDDHLLITKEIYLYDFSSLAGLKKIFSESTHYIYQPIVNISYSIELKLFKTNAAFFHFDNIMLHIINTILVFLIFLKLTKHFYVSFIVMALFAIHPVHVEPVAWISARKDLLYSLFYLFSIYFYLKSYENKRVLFLIFSFFSFILSNMSKPMAVTLPIIMILLDYIDNKLDKKNLKIYILYAVISIAFVILGICVHYDGNPVSPTNNLLKNIICTHFHYLFYLYKFILPINLYCSYPYFYPLNEFPPLYITLSPIIVYTGIYFLFKTLKYSKKVFFGFSLFVIILLPSSGVMPTGIVKVADRYVYLAYMGLFYLVAILIVYLYEKSKIYLKYLLVFLCLLIFSVLVYLSYERVLDWKNNDQEPPEEKLIYFQDNLLYL